MLKNQETLLYSIPSGDISLIRQAIEQGANVNYIHDQDGTGMRLSYLHTAAAVGRYDVMDLLIANGTNVNARSRDGETPLQFAAGANNVLGAKLLLSSGANLNATDKNKVSAIEAAVINKHPEMIRMLMEGGAHKSERVIQQMDDQPDLMGKTAPQRPSPVTAKRVLERRQNQCTPQWSSTMKI